MKQVGRVEAPRAHAFLVLEAQQNEGLSMKRAQAWLLLRRRLGCLLGSFRGGLAFWLESSKGVADWGSIVIAGGTFILPIQMLEYYRVSWQGARLPNITFLVVLV